MIRRAKRMKTSQIDAAMEMLRSAGRNGDTELAHVNPREKAILKAMGGAGSRNPRTGLREYFVDGGDYNSGDARSFDGADQPDAPSGMGPSPGGDITYEPLAAPSYNFDVDRIMSELGPKAPAGTSTSFSAKGPDQLGLPGFGGPTAPPTPDFEAMASPVGQTTQPSRGGQVASAISDFLKSTLENPRNIPGMGLIGMALGQSMSALNKAARDAGYSVLDPSEPEERAAYEAGFAGNRNVADNVSAALGAVPVAAPAPAYLRGTPTTPPQEISSFIGPGMTDLQQRALISTYGTQGVNSAFRTDPVRRYYANLLSRGLISDRGVPVQQPYVLPIEQQYASMVLGRPMTNPSDAAAAYESIRGLL